MFTEFSERNPARRERVGPGGTLGKILFLSQNEELLTEKVNSLRIKNVVDDEEPRTKAQGPRRTPEKRKKRRGKLISTSPAY